MPKISKAQGASYEGVIPEHDAELRDNVEVQERIQVQPQDRPGENGTTPEGDGDYAGLTGGQLSAELEKRGLPKTGAKSDLIARLEEDDAAKDEE